MMLPSRGWRALVGAAALVVIPGIVMSGCGSSSVDSSSGEPSASAASEFARLEKAADQTIEGGQLRVIERKQLETDCSDAVNG
jgi:hypothetical protein